MLDYLFVHPIVGAVQVSEATSLSLVSAYALITEFEKMGILTKVAGDRRDRIYRFAAYFKVFE